MGIQTMGSQDSRGQQSKFQPLARQSSLYGLTLDEVQNQLGDSGKPLGSMNLDELLKNVWMADANQAMGMDIENVVLGDSLGSTSALQRQASMQLTRALSKKTVDEVWRDIQQGDGENKEEKKHQERQPTLGEMTLEDFLVKAGVVAGTSLEKKNVAPTIGVDLMAAPPQNFSEQTQWLQYQHPSIQHQQQQLQVQPPEQNIMGVFMLCQSVPQTIVPGAGATPLIDVVYPENQLTISSPLVGAFSDTQTPGRKRAASGDVLEKTVERRQKRMIKNRESAARSRARKQAYTNELENKVSRLEEENEKLKKQKELENVLPCLPPSEPKYQLRRTSSAPF